MQYLLADILQLRANIFQLCAQLIETVLRQLQLLGDELQRLLVLGDLLLGPLQLSGQLFCFFGVLASLRLALFIGGFEIGYLLLLRGQLVRQGLGRGLQLRRHLLEVGDPGAGVGAGGLQLRHLPFKLRQGALELGCIKGQADNQAGRSGRHGESPPSRHNESAARVDDAGGIETVNQKVFQQFCFRKVRITSISSPS